MKKFLILTKRKLLSITFFLLLLTTLSCINSQKLFSQCAITNYCLGYTTTWCEEGYCSICLICGTYFKINNGIQGTDYIAESHSITWLRPGTYELEWEYIGGITGIEYCNFKKTVNISNCVKDYNCREGSFSLNSPIIYENSHYSSKQTITLLPGFSTYSGQYFELSICSESLKSTKSTMDSFMDSFNETKQNVNSTIQEPSNNIHCYPNPTNGILTIQAEEILNGKIRLSNELNRVIYSNLISSNIFQIDMSIYPNGLYFLIIETKERVYVNKIVRQ